MQERTRFHSVWRIYIPGIIYAYIFLDVYTWPSTAVSYDLFDGSGVPADLDNVHT